MLVQKGRHITGSSLVAADCEYGKLSPKQRELCSSKPGRQPFHRDEVEIVQAINQLVERELQPFLRKLATIEHPGIRVAVRLRDLVLVSRPRPPGKLCSRLGCPTGLRDASHPVKVVFCRTCRHRLVEAVQHSAAVDEVWVARTDDLPVTAVQAPIRSEGTPGLPSLPLTRDALELGGEKYDDSYDIL